VPTSLKRDIEASLQTLEPLVRLLARQLAHEHFAAATRQANGKDQSDTSDHGSTKDE
jgi:hypothetical protein